MYKKLKYYNKNRKTIGDFAMARIGHRTSLSFACPAVYHVLMHDICFRGAKCGKEGFSREMLLTCI